MHLIVGLGNPGGKYAGHRHNIGFMAVDRIVSHHGLGPWRAKFSGQFADGAIDGDRVGVLKPETHMNLSGDSVGAAVRFFKLSPDDVTVIYDEIDLSAGKIKVKTGGGTGGHNGIRSVAAHLGADFSRVRLGIGHPGHRQLVHGHVLGDFAKADLVWLEPLLDTLAANASLMVQKDAANLMNRVAIAMAKISDKPVVDKTGKTSGPSEGQVRHSTADGGKKDPDGGPMSAMLRKLFGR
ncbi:MAG: aminoacyl-tRNA hydrolase [Alphaproteobacteria bacterium]|nr:aminoacyl-tRNA hydrolase [Alphaproteobacteria bacterium]